MAEDHGRKPLIFVGSSHEDLSVFPSEVREVLGYALHVAQLGSKHRDAKPLKGFKGAGVLEVVDDFDGDTYRAVYTVRFSARVYVLHVFQKKAKSGRKTAKHDVDLIHDRLQAAERIHMEWLQRKKDRTE